MRWSNKEGHEPLEKRLKVVVEGLWKLVPLESVV